MGGRGEVEFTLLPAQVQTKVICKKMKIKEIIKNWKFASCPVEQKSIFWRWRKEELELLAKYIQELIQEARSEKDEEWTNFLRKK